MRVLVCGGRDFCDRALLKSVLDQMHIEEIISGAARGADSLAIEYAEENKIPYKAFPADWETHGKSAGAKRNISMLTESRPDRIVAFKGGKGTDHMTSSALKFGYVLTAGSGFLEFRILDFPQQNKR